MKKSIIAVMFGSLILGSCKTADIKPILVESLPAEWEEKKADYQADWESLDSRPVSDWFKDAKFGIFIHWGLYSVPAWAPPGVYAEWYQYWMEEGVTWGRDRNYGKAVRNYHYETYGPESEYKDFTKEFKVENFDPGSWADLFEKAGARYTVLTSKHHDGFALWPSDTADKTWERSWNSVSSGSGRDLVGELGRAVKEKGLKYGLYYSLYEWYNPLWRYPWKRSEYVSEHYIPQIKDLVTSYNPDLLWVDGEWGLKSERWKSPEFLSWLFNHVPDQNGFVINDRWGKGDRGIHGGYYTAEYGFGFQNDDHPWEECRGMGYSFGYNQTETADDYRSTEELLITLIDIVSRGGNLLLNIGPKADGTIPEIMVERLEEMGEWLDIYGDAIYGTRSWIRSCQWSGGEIPDPGKPEDYDIVKSTLDPDEGMAVKELFFTARENGAGEIETLYVIVPRLSGPALSVKQMDNIEVKEIRDLESGNILSFEHADGILEIDVRSIKKSLVALKLSIQ